MNDHYLSDAELLANLKESIESELTATRRKPIEDPFYVLSTLKTIFDRVSDDGMDQHQLFDPVVKAMAKLSEHELEKAGDVAKHLSSALTDETNNPWRALLK